MIFELHNNYRTDEKEFGDLPQQIRGFAGIQERPGPQEEYVDLLPCSFKYIGKEDDYSEGTFGAR